MQSQWCAKNFFNQNSWINQVNFIQLGNLFIGEENVMYCVPLDKENCLGVNCGHSHACKGQTVDFSFYIFGKAISTVGSWSDKNSGVQRLWSQGENLAVWLKGSCTGFESAG